MSDSLTSIRRLALAGSAGFGLSLLGALPASAHAMAGEGALAGFTHPLLGPDHLLLLVAVGGAAAMMGFRVLAFALAGALLGGMAGSAGLHLPLAEVLAALAVSLVGALILQSRHQRGDLWMKVSGPLVAVSVAIHALLHGQEAGAGTLGWWLGALAASSLVTAIVVGTLRRLGTVWTLRLAVLLTLAGGVLALGPMTGLLTAAAG